MSKSCFFFMPSGSLSISIVIITKEGMNGLTCRPPSAQDEETISLFVKVE